MLYLASLSDMDTGIYTCAVIKETSNLGKMALKETPNSKETDSIRSNESTLWDSNEERAKFLLDKMSTMGFGENGQFSLINFKTIKLRVRTFPAPVSRFSVRASTIIAVLIWEYPPKDLSAFNVRSFTAEFRKLPVDENDTQLWINIDPYNISPNIVSCFLFFFKGVTSLLTFKLH